MGRALRFVATLLLTAVVACGESGPDVTPATVSISPSSRTIEVGETFTVTATVANAAGTALTGIPLTYQSSQPSVATVSGAGVVTALAVGTTSITAQAGTVTSSAVSVTVGVATLTKQSTDPASVVAGATFGSEIRVRLSSPAGAGKPGVVVTFAVTAGGGTLAATSVTTDASGDAATVFTTGKTVGTNTVTATVAGLAPVTFSATTIAGPASTFSFTPKLSIVNAGSTVTPTLSVTDANGNAVTGTAVTFTSRSTSVATVSNSGVVTGASAGQSVIVASSAAGSDSMLVVVSATDGTVLLTDLSSFSLAANTDVAVTISLDLRSSGEKLGSASVKLEWDPTVIAYQSHAAPATGASPTVNSTGAPTGSLVFSMADAAGLTGTVQLIRVTFKAGAAAKAGTLKLTATEVTAAGTFTDLTARTTAVTMPISTK